MHLLLIFVETVYETFQKSQFTKKKVLQKVNIFDSQKLIPATIISFKVGKLLSKSF